MKRTLLVVMACMLVLGASAMAQNLVSNGGFETGNFAGWSQQGNTGFTGVAGCFSSTCPHSGSFQAYFGPIGSTGGINQTLATDAGSTYTVDFWLANDGGSPNS